MRRQITGFTLVEVLVAATIVVILMGILLSMTDQTQRLMKGTSSKVEQFQGARVAFESMTRRLAQATLNTYWDYQYAPNAKPGAPPIGYQRSSELRFVSGVTNTLTGGTGTNGYTRPGHSVFFHAPNGYVSDQKTYGVLDHLINLWGYFVEIGSDADSLPQFLQNLVPARTRFRLMELRQPSEQLMTYQYQQVAAAPTFSQGAAWFAPLVTATTRPTRVLAENIVALVVLPRLSKSDEQLWMTQNGSRTPPILAPLYSYDSTNNTVTDPILNPHNQLPPVVQVAMIAIDEPSAQKLQDQFGTDPNLGVSYSSLFRNPAVLEDDPSTAAPDDGDLSKLAAILASQRVSYRIFSTNVSIRGAKWSRNQSK